jgi:hypothetical protein
MLRERDSARARELIVTLFRNDAPYRGVQLLLQTEEEGRRRRRR